LVSCITEEKEFTKNLIFANIQWENARIYAGVVKRAATQRRERRELKLHSGKDKKKIKETD